MYGIHSASNAVHFISLLRLNFVRNPIRFVHNSSTIFDSTYELYDSKVYYAAQNTNVSRWLPMLLEAKRLQKNDCIIRYLLQNKFDMFSKMIRWIFFWSKMKGWAASAVAVVSAVGRIIVYEHRFVDDEPWSVETSTVNVRAGGVHGTVRGTKCTSAPNEPRLL